MIMKFSKRTRQNDQMGKKGTCISQGKYLEIEQCISLCTYIMLNLLYGDVRHIFSNIVGDS